MSTESIICRCNELAEMQDGAVSDQYKQHLRQVRVDAANWEIEYVCPITGHRWIEDFPMSYAHGGGPSRLRRVTDQPPNPLP